MIIFELLVNGKLVATAGAEDLSVLSQTVTARGKLGPVSQGTSNIKDGYILEVGLTGLTSSQNEPQHTHLQWFGAGLNVGDELTLRIADRPNADKPAIHPGPGEA